MATFKETLANSGVFTYPVDVPINAGARRSIHSALWAIEKQIEFDDDGCQNETKCEPDDPRCSFCEMVYAKNELELILNPIHRSLNPDRLSSPAEEIYLRLWQKENDRQRGINHGYGMLELILTPTRIREDRVRYIGEPPFYIPPVSQRDAEVAASVIQFLGTNGGRCLMETAEREIKLANAERTDMERERTQNIFKRERVVSRFENLARAAATSAVRPDEKRFEDLVRSIIAAIQASGHSEEDAFMGSGI